LHKLNKLKCGVCKWGHCDKWQDDWQASLWWQE